MAPSSEGQVRAMAQAYQQAEWQPSDVQFIECHATGTPLGDRVELESYQQLWEGHQGDCVLSSVKGNIGHLLTAAGASGLVRTLLSMEKGVLPPSANVNTPILEKELDESSFRILKKQERWQPGNGLSRKAAISGFGFGGVNAHVLVEEYHEDLLEELPAKASEKRPVAIVGLSTSLSSDRELDNPKSWNTPVGKEKRWFGAENSKWFRSRFTEHEFEVKQRTALEVPFGLFKIPPNEIKSMLPQQVLALLVAAEAIYDAGNPSLAGERTGIFVGVELDGMTNSYRQRWTLEKKSSLWNIGLGLGLNEDQLEQWAEQLKDSFGEALTADAVMGSLASIIPSRIAREFDVGGPSFTVSGMENSGLHALKLAVGAIQRGELDYGVVGAVDFASQLLPVMNHRRLREANGNHGQYQYEDGAITVIVKDYEEAIRQGDKIYGVIEDIDGMVSGVASSIWPVPENFSKFVRSQFSKGRYLYRSEGIIAGKTISDRKLAESVSEEGCVAAFPISQHSWYQGAATGLIKCMESALTYQRSLLKGWQSEEFCLLAHTAASGSSISIAFKGHEQDQLPQLLEMPLPVTKCFSVTIPGLSFVIPPIPAPIRRVVGGTKVGRIEKPHQGLDRLPSQVNFVEQLLQAMKEAEAANADAQGAYEHLSLSAMKLGKELAQGSQSRGGAETLGLFLPTWTGVPGNEDLIGGEQDTSQSIFPESNPIPKPSQREPLSLEASFLSYEDCVEFAEGKIAKVFGEDFAFVDQFPTRVRLPTDKLLLCHRVMSLVGEAFSLQDGELVTEHDVFADSWYLDHGKIPTSIAIEAGQADLLLSAWLGADKHTQGEAVYRLLDAKVTFHSKLPRPDSIIRYKIKIKNFFQRGDTLMFRFGFEASVGSTPLMSMVDGCAGFFTPEELEQGRGIVKTEEKAQKGRFVGGYLPLFVVEQETYNDEQMQSLSQGELQSCFGADFESHCLVDPVRMPAGDLKLVDRILSLETFGGLYGVGKIVGEADVDPSAWYLTSHFIDDNVMPGTLMYECCLHTLRIFMLRHGLVGEDHELSFDPIEGEESQLKCRGQVLSSTTKIRYETHIKEIGFGPNAYAIADAYMYADDRCIVDISNMTLSITGVNKKSVDKIWAGEVKKPVFSYEQIVEFSSGLPSKAFGDQYKPFDHQRKMARLPRLSAPRFIIEPKHF